MNEKEFAELAAGHALHALSAEDEAKYIAALRAHPEWGALANSDAETAATLGDAVAPVAPSAHVRDALLAQIASTPQLSDGESDAATEVARKETPSTPNKSLARPRKLRMLFALAASFALLVGVGYGAVALTNYLNRPPSVVALAEIESAPDAEQATVPLESGGVATLHWSPEMGTAVLVADGLEPLGSEQSYQLWFVRGDTPVPAGVFDAQRGETIALLSGTMHAGDVVAVTQEEAGGSPNGLPTSDPIFAIATTS